MRDAYDAFTDAGAYVIGVSSDCGEAHATFASHRPFGIIPCRATFVIDRDGTIRYAFNSQFMATAHVANALHALGRT